MAADYTGTIGDDTQAGTGADESFDYSQGGHDTLSGGGGADFFDFGGAFDAGDQVDGGDGFDELMLIGDYSGGLALVDASFTNIERLSLSDGFDYSLTLADGNFATVLTISDRMCRWPIGDPSASEFHFCGRSPKSGSPYCEAHARKAYQPQQQHRHKDKGRMAS